MKALEQWQIDDIIKQKISGKTDMELAQKYNVHYKTIQNYTKEHRQKLPQEELESELSDSDKFTSRNKKELTNNSRESQNIKVIGITPSKTLNFYNVTEIKREKEWIKLLSNDVVVGLLIPQNVTAIVPLEE